MIEVESKVFAQQRMIAASEDDVSLLPDEFKSCTRRSMRRSSDFADRMTAFAILCVAAAGFVPFFATPFASRAVKLRATALERGEALGFVTFLGQVKDRSPQKKMKDMFGWGGLDLVSRASQALAPHVQNCRSLLQSTRHPPTFAFNFDVKIDVSKPGFLVNGLLAGQEDEPEVAACLRDKINALQIPDFANLRAAQPESYKLHLGVQLAHGADGGSP